MSLNKTVQTKVDAMVSLPFWVDIVILQATAFLHIVLRKYEEKYFTPAEIDASDIVLDALADLPHRISAAQPAK